MADEPQLPQTVSDAGGHEPALSGAVPAEDALRAAGVFATTVDRDRTDCKGLSVAEWWRTCRFGDIMAMCLPSGESGSPHRRKLVELACRFARMVEADWPAGDIRPWRAIKRAELWSAGDPAVTIEMLVEAAECNDDPDMGPAVSAATAACSVPYAVDAARYVAVTASYAAYCRGPGRPEYDAVLAKCADLIREYHRDPAPVFAAKQAERLGRRR